MRSGDIRRHWNAPRMCHRELAAVDVAPFQYFTCVLTCGPLCVSYHVWLAANVTSDIQGEVHRRARAKQGGRLELKRTEPGHFNKTEPVPECRRDIRASIGSRSESTASQTAQGRPRRQPLAARHHRDGFHTLPRRLRAQRLRADEGRPAHIARP